MTNVTIISCDKCLDDLYCNNTEEQEIIATLNLTVYSSGKFYIQCSSYMSFTSNIAGGKTEIFSEAMELIVREGRCLS